MEFWPGVSASSRPTVSSAALQARASHTKNSKSFITAFLRALQPFVSAPARILHGMRQEKNEKLKIPFLN